MTNLEGTAYADVLERALDAAIDGMAILDDDGTYLYVNSAHATLYGYESADALVGEHWTSLYDDATVRRFERDVMPELRERGEWRGEAQGRRRNGETFPQELSLSRMADGRSICVVRDISQRRERRESLEQYESILKDIRDGLYTLDTDGQVTWVNQTAVEAFDIGYSRDELVGSSVAKVLNRKDIEKCLSVIQELLETGGEGSRRCEVALQTAYGSEIPCELHLTLLRDADGSFQGTLGVVRDITERKRREQRLSVLNRVLRHNLRNDLNVIMGEAERLGADDVDTDTSQLAETVYSTAERLTDMAEKARTIETALERDATHQTTIDIASVVRRRCAWFREQYPAAALTVEAPPSGAVMADETVSEVIDNLLENAVEHTTETPHVSVSVSHDEDGWVSVRVSDDGPGIPQAELDALHTEEETQLAHGTGLGLWVVYWLVDSYGGDVSFSESPSGGATVDVRLRAASSTRR